MMVIGAAAGAELGMGRPAVYRRGPVRLWSGNVHSDQNSQQIADPYTFTHVIHGAAFYALTTLVRPASPAAARLVATAVLESVWEVYENTDAVINRYREATISLGYFGDSVINSVCDILACLCGFWLTRRLPARATVAWVIVTEAILALWIRDNLTLNILMLIYPIDAIKSWQMGA
jgi:hypothetical protein